MPNFGVLNVSRTCGRADPHFLERRVEQAGHRLLHLVDDVVDDRVQADVDLLALGDVGGVAVGPHVEADDDGVRRRRQQHVRLVDRADAAVDDADLDLLVAQLRQRVAEHFGRALHVRLDDDRQLLHAAFGNLRLQRLEREPRALAAERLVLRLRLAEERDLPRLDRVGERLERVARLRQAAEAEHFDRRRRPGVLQLPAAIVDERADLADDRAGNDGVADVQRAVLDEDRRHRAAALVQLRFEHGARRVALRIRLELAQLGDEQDHLEQQLEVLLLLRRDLDHDGLCRPTARGRGRGPPAPS